MLAMKEFDKVKGSMSAADAKAVTDKLADYNNAADTDVAKAAAD